MMTPTPSGMWRREHLGPAAALAAYWTTGWTGTCAVISVVAMVTIYRVMAERERRRVLLDIYLNAPAGTELIQGGGPEGPSLRVRVGDDERRSSPPPQVTRLPVTRPGSGRLARRGRP